MDRYIPLNRPADRQVIGIEPAIDHRHLDPRPIAPTPGPRFAV